MSTSFSEHYSLLSLPSSHQLPPLDPNKKSNKISDIVKLKRMLKRWRKQANSSVLSSPTLTTTRKPKNMGRSISFNNIQTSSGDKRLTRTLSSKGITFLKRTLSFPDNISTAGATLSSQGVRNVPKGYLAVDVGEEMKRFSIPMSYLRHKVFVDLLKEAEEEFGFQQEGVLRIPCEVADFELILKGLEPAKQSNRRSKEAIHQGCISVESLQIPTPPHLGTGQYHPASPMCR